MISLANTINDEKIQQRAWIIIGNREHTPAHIRLEATKNIQNDSIRKDLLKILAGDATVNICLRLKAAQLIDKYLRDNQLYHRLVKEASKEDSWSVYSIIESVDMPYDTRLDSLQELESYANADELFAIIATHPLCDREFRFKAAQKIKDQTTQQNAYYCNILNLKEAAYPLYESIPWLKCITDKTFLHVKDLHLWDIINHPRTGIASKIRAAQLLSKEEGQKAFIHLYHTIDSHAFIVGANNKLKLLTLIKDKQFLKEQEPYLWGKIQGNCSNEEKIQAAELLSIDSQPKAFLYICEHSIPSTAKLKELFSRISDEHFLKEKQAVLKAIINNPKRNTSLQVAAVQLIGSPYVENILTILKHPIQEPIEENLARLIDFIKLIEDKNQQEELTVELLSNFKDALHPKLNCTLYHIQDLELKTRVFKNLLHSVNDADFPKFYAPYTIYCAYQDNPENLASFEWDASTLIEYTQSFNAYRANQYFTTIISYIPSEKRDSILEELFKRVNLLVIQENDNFDSNAYIELFKQLHDLSSEEARETILFAIAGNNHLEQNFRIRLITELTPNNATRGELLEIIEHSHEAQGGAVDPKRKHTTKRAR